MNNNWQVELRRSEIFIEWKVTHYEPRRGVIQHKKHVIPSGFLTIDVIFYNHSIPSGLFQYEKIFPIYELPLTNYH